jgi:hypothetical protein
MQTVTLSESAVATLRFHVRGWKPPIRDRDLPAYQMSPAVGLLIGDGSAGSRSWVARGGLFDIMLTCWVGHG